MKLLIAEEVPAPRRPLPSPPEEMEPAASECRDGREMTTACAARQPDRVPLDLDPSDADAPAATRQAGTDHPRAKVVIVCHGDNLLLRDAARAAGAVSYLLEEHPCDVRRRPTRGRN